VTRVGGPQGQPERGPPIPPKPIWDAVVVGAGPAGAMAAYELSRMGREVLLLDRSTFPRWKVCGGTLSPGTQDLLAQVGLNQLLQSSGAESLHTLRLGGWSMRVDLSLNGSMVLSRRTLDSALVEAAEAKGAHFCPGARAKLGDLSRDRRILKVSTGEGEVEVSARVVVAADGLGSGLMVQAGVPGQVPSSSKRPVVGLGGVFRSSVNSFESGVIHMAMGRDGYVGIVQVEDGSLNVAAALSPRALRDAESPAALVESLLLGGGWPALPGSPVTGWRGTPELTRRTKHQGAERLLAVGDAGGYVEPFTGEGVFWALSGSCLLAPMAAVVSDVWDDRILDTWTTAHQRLIGRAQRLCRATSWVLARPSLSRSLLGVLRSHPHLAGPLVRRIGAPIVSLA